MRHFSELTPDEQDDVKRRSAIMWARGLYAREICNAVDITPRSFESLTVRDREAFPTRIMGGGEASSDAHKGAKGNKHSGDDVIDGLNRRFGPAFRPLPGAVPAMLTETVGCSWPVSVSAEGPLSEKHTGLSCGRPRSRDGEKTLAYCAAHYRVAYKPRAS